MKHFKIHFLPDNTTIQIHEGATLMEAAGQAQIILATPCGGVGRCGKCKVTLLPSQKEVLACHYRIGSDLEVLIPDSSRFFSQKILEHGIRRDVATNPAIKKVFINIPETGLDAFCKALSDKLDAPFLIRDSMDSDLADLLAAKSNATAVLSLQKNDVTPPESACYTLMGIEPGDTAAVLYGVAVDIGTTTVVARLIDLISGKPLAVAAAGNPQAGFGADVVSRIGFSTQEGGREKLQKSIVSCLNALIRKVAEKAGISANDIYEITAAGNTTMSHLLLGYPVHQLGQAPYRAYSLLAADRNPADLDIRINPLGNIHVLPNIAGFVGSDTVAAALACGMDINKAATLLVDIGTNGEIVFGDQDHLLAASCAAGPALEGAGIEFGSRAQAGAIERVLFDGSQIDIDVIGGVQPVSICGSGLIDAAAVMLEAGVLDATGRFFEEAELNPLVSKDIRNRLICYRDEPAFVIAGTYEQGQWRHSIVLTQKDIRQLQLAKAAIRAGIEMLLKTAGSTAADIQQLLLAGAFGNYIQKSSAIRIGLLPDLPPGKIHFVGNSAGTGSEMALTNKSMRALASELAQRIKYVEIAYQSEFQMVFSECLFFPEK